MKYVKATLMMLAVILVMPFFLLDEWLQKRERLKVARRKFNEDNYDAEE